jgi:transposase
MSVAQVARRNALNANLIFKRLRDVRYVPGPAQTAVDTPCFLPVEIVDRARPKESRPVTTESQTEFERAGGHWLRISVAYDPKALARLLRRLRGLSRFRRTRRSG